MTDRPGGSTSRRRTFPARFEILPETAAFVEGFCASHGVRHEDALRVVLVVEELVTNTITHGHRHECNAPIAIGLTCDAREIAIDYEDTAPAYDPTVALEQSGAPLAARLDERPEGQLGMRLIGQLASHALYEHSGGRNRLRLVVERHDT